MKTHTLPENKNCTPFASIATARANAVAGRPVGAQSIQRKASCACGGGCPRCQAKSNNLKISQPNDPAEVEADQIADKVMRMPIGETSPDVSSVSPASSIHRKCSACEEGDAPKIQRKPLPSGVGVPSQSPMHVRDAISSGGQPLDHESRSFFEPRFGYDLSGVRIHSDALAGQSARAINAKAYTLASNIVFGVGEYQPNSEGGKHLLAHELTHVLQQASAESVGDVQGTRPDTFSPGSRRGDANYSQATVRSGLVLARQPIPKGPSPTNPDEDKFEDANSKLEGRWNTGAPSLWGWGGEETKNRYQRCTVVPMDRERFLKFHTSLPKAPLKPQRKTPNEGPSMVLGATWPDLKSAVPPAIAAEPVVEDGKTLFRLKPTRAEMPLIKAAHTMAGRFQDGVSSFMLWEANNERVCPNLGGRAPLFWDVTGGGAMKLWAGEMEHCSDIRAAFDITLVPYASVINNEAAAERRYNSTQQAVDETKKRLQQSIPVDPVGMLNAYGTEIEKTRIRDTSGWHDGKFAPMTKPQKNNCVGHVGIIDETGFPGIGDGPGTEKHTSQEVIEGIVSTAKGTP